MSPRDLAAVAGYCRDLFGTLRDRDWQSRAANVEWTCRETLEHLCGIGYSFALASRATEPRDRALVTATDAPIDSRVTTIYEGALVLAEVARAAPADARGYHPAGMADAEGFLAMEIDEQLVHSADVAAGFGAPFDPPLDVVRRVLDRLFPWWPHDEDPWQALLWANGRGALPEHPELGETWLWHCSPLSEWDGTIPAWDASSRRPASE